MRSFECLNLGAAPRRCAPSQPSTERYAAPPPQVPTRTQAKPKPCGGNGLAKTDHDATRREIRKQERKMPGDDDLDDAREWLWGSCLGAVCRGGDRRDR